MTGLWAAGRGDAEGVMMAGPLLYSVGAVGCCEHDEFGRVKAGVEGIEGAMEWYMASCWMPC